MLAFVRCALRRFAESYATDGRPFTQPRVGDSACESLASPHHGTRRSWLSGSRRRRSGCGPSDGTATVQLDGAFDVSVTGAIASVGLPVYITSATYAGSSDMSMGDGWIATGVLIKD